MKTKEQLVAEIEEKINSNPKGYAFALLDECIIREATIRDLTTKNMTLAKLYITTASPCTTTGIPELGEMPTVWIS